MTRLRKAAPIIDPCCPSLPPTTICRSMEKESVCSAAQSKSMAPCHSATSFAATRPFRKRLLVPLAPSDTEDAIINPYQLLQVRKDATKSEIRQTYRRLALWYHPARTKHISGKEKERRQNMFTLLAACCETLLERESRSRLDSLLLQWQKRMAAAPGGSPQNNSHKREQKQDQQQQQHGLPFLTGSFSGSSNEEEQWDVSCHGAMSSMSQHQQQHQHHESCHVNELQPLVKSCSTEDMDNFHHTHAETNSLFGGPLSLLFQARSFQRFTDPYVVFERVFGSSLFSRGPKDKIAASNEKKESSLNTNVDSPLPISTTGSAPSRSSAAWTGSSEILGDGTIVYTTTRVLKNRKVTKREYIRTDPVTGHTMSSITVTGEDIVVEQDNFSNEKKILDNHHNYWTCCNPLMVFSTSGGDSEEKEMPLQSGSNVFRRMWCVV